MRLSVAVTLLLKNASAFTFTKKHVSSLNTRTRFQKSNIIALYESTVAEEESAIETTAASSAGSFSLESDNKGPSDDAVHTLTINLPYEETPLIIQTGKIGRQAAGAVTLSRGETMLYATASRDKDPKESIDFLPLSVEYQERMSSVGTTKGGFLKRDGRPGEHEILTCRLIDRPIRPLIADGWRHETQLLSWVLSYDNVRTCETLAIIANSAALWISDVPLKKPIAAANVGFIDDKLVLNPTNEQMEKSKLTLTIAGTKDAVLMIEGAADFLPEDLMIEAVKLGHSSVKLICEALEEFGKVAGKEKNYSTLPSEVEGLQEAVDSLMTEKVDYCYTLTNKADQSAEMSKMSKFVKEELEEQYPEQKNAIGAAYKDLLSRRMFELAKNTGKRVDGRDVDQVRRIDIETSLLPRAHGSALFTRGETQSIATVTLGDTSMQQKLDKLDGTESKRFYLQYTFPPSCVGETGRTGAPGRREIGHGNLAERALVPALPSEEEFPYSIRVESLITESHGSSSMASVCGGCLCLMDAGVPIKRPVSGIAMGMLLGDKGTVSDDNAVIVSDILGIEDALGTMDFKVAGDREGITTFQLDIKCEGLSLDTMAKALEQARLGRLHILDEMDKALPKYRGDLPDTVPKLGTTKIEEGTIGKVIGPGGKQIRAIIEDFELVNMDVKEDGSIQLTAMNTTKIEMAIEFIGKLVEGGGGRGGGRGGAGKEPRPQYTGPPPEVGQVYKGKIISSHNFGVFVEIIPGAEDGSSPGLEGLVHVSEVHTERVRNCEAFVSGMRSEEMEVKVIGFNDKGKLQLSRKAVILDRKNGVKVEQVDTAKISGNGAGMSQEESDVIAQAIEGILDVSDTI